MIKSISLLSLLVTSVAIAQDKPTEDDYYKLLRFPIPEGVFLEVGAIEPIPGGRIAVSSRRGEIYIVDNAYSGAVEDAKFTRFAHGLHEVLGLAWKDGGLYTTQRCELTKISDSNGDGKADVFKTVTDAWGINGDYHEYTFGSKFDKDGNIWLPMCLTGSFNSDSKFRGWCMRATEDGKLIPTCSGVRSPGGVGFNATGDVFYTDNQGPWNGTCTLKWLKPGSFQGHPGGNKWYAETDGAIGPAPKEPVSGSRIMTEADKIPEFEPPVVMFPYSKMGKSASGIACDVSGGKFGPFKDQLFVGDQHDSTIMRCFIEQIDGHYQGACFPFRRGFGSGSLAVEFGEDGSLFVGGTNRGWGSVGKEKFALERLVWTGKTPFEVLEMKAKPDGFELTFTEPIDKATAEAVASYELETYTYIYQSSYGSPEVDHTKPTITKAIAGANGHSVRLTIDGLQRGHVHELHLKGVRSAKQSPLLHDAAYYTLNYIPK